MDPNLLPEGSLDILNHPAEIAIVLILTVISTIWSIQGLRRKDIPKFILGIAAGIPTIAIESWKAWLIAIVIGAFAMWLKGKIENVG